MPRHNPPEGFVATSAELAAALECSERWCRELRKKPGAPQRTPEGWYNVEAFRAFRMRVMAESANEAEKAYRRERYELDLRSRRAQVELQEMESATKRGMLAPIDEVIETVTAMIRALERECHVAEADIAAQTNGMAILEARKVIRDRLKKLRKTMSLGGWAKKKAFWNQLYEALGGLHKSLDLGSGRRATSTSRAKAGSKPGAA